MRPGLKPSQHRRAGTAVDTRQYSHQFSRVNDLSAFPLNGEGTFPETSVKNACQHRRPRYVNDPSDSARYTIRPRHALVSNSCNCCGLGLDSRLSDSLDSSFVIGTCDSLYARHSTSRLVSSTPLFIGSTAVYPIRRRRTTNHPPITTMTNEMSLLNLFLVLYTVWLKRGKNIGWWEAAWHDGWCCDRKNQSW